MKKYLELSQYREIFLNKFDENMCKQLASDIEIGSVDIQDVMECFFDENIRVCQRASNVLVILCKKDKGILKDFIEDMLNCLHSYSHQTQIRNIVRIFQFVEFPDDLEGRVYDKCFSYLMDNSTTNAIRVFSMTVCANLTMKYPELKEELRDVIGEIFPYGTPAFKNRGSKLVKLLK